MSTSAIEITPAFRRALAMMEEGAQPVLLTGKAGTGKSTLLQLFRERTKKSVAFLAPTGVAAVNIQGQTIHSFFGFRTNITPERAHTAGQAARRRQERLYADLDAVVLDEVSMVRADLLDAADRFLRAARGRPRTPFGGVQLIMIGDLYQLPPIVTAADRAVFTAAYPGPYFFHAPGFAALDLAIIELDRVFRQRDPVFIALLNAVRNNSVTAEDLAALNARCQSGHLPAEDTITLTATNDAAATINAAQLARLRGRATHCRAEVSGDFPVEQMPTDRELALKVGARVMLLNNDSAGRWINGTLGTITEIGDDEITVRLADGPTVAVTPYTWQAHRYVFDAKRRALDTEPVGSFTQFPLRLAWAVTIHKSQGKTFDRVCIDLGRGAFATGQTYVALSRCRTLEGIVLQRPLRASDLRVDWRVQRFLTGLAYARSEDEIPLEDKVAQLERAVAQRSPVAIVYLKNTDVRSERVIEPIEVGEMEYTGRPFLGVRAYCRTRQEERVFRVDRILELELVAPERRGRRQTG